MNPNSPSPSWVTEENQSDAPLELDQVRNRLQRKVQLACDGGSRRAATPDIEIAHGEDGEDGMAADPDDGRVVGKTRDHLR